MHAERSNAIDFWPGYVDALINVVLNLLFVVSIFCGGLLAVGLQVSSPSPVRERPPASAPAPAPAPAPATAKPVDPVLVARNLPVPQAPAAPAPAATREVATAGVDAPVPGESAHTASENAFPGLPNLTLHVRSSSVAAIEAEPVRITEATLPEGGWRLLVRYPAGTLTLDKAARATLARLVNAERRGRMVQIVASTDLEQATARHATYRRLLAVRDALVALGNEPARIEIRLLTGGQWPERQGGTVWIQEPPVAGEVPDTPVP